MREHRQQRKQLLEVTGWVNGKKFKKKFNSEAQLDNWILNAGNVEVVNSQWV